MYAVLCTMLQDAMDNFYTPICSLNAFPGLAEFPDIVPHPNELSTVSGSRVANAERFSLAEEKEPAGVA